MSGRGCVFKLGLSPKVLLKLQSQQSYSHKVTGLILLVCDAPHQDFNLKCLFFYSSRNTDSEGCVNYSHLRDSELHRPK